MADRRGRARRVLCLGIILMTPQNPGELAAAIAEFEQKLPGWWWSVGSCSVSRDASCGPDRQGPDARLLDIKEFDEGFHHDDREGTCADALRLVMNWALERKQIIQEEQRN